jgi:hypothetical protein
MDIHSYTEKSGVQSEDGGDDFEDSREIEQEFDEHSSKKLWARKTFLERGVIYNFGSFNMAMFVH